MFNETKRKSDTFSSERLRFRGIEEKDADIIVGWRSNLKLIQFSLNMKPLTKEDHASWFVKYQTMHDRLDFLVIDCQDDQPIGIVGLRAINESDQSAEVSALIGEKPRQGFAYESLVAACKYAYDELNLRRIWAQVHPENIASICLFEKMGFICRDRDQWLLYDYELC